MEKKDGLDIAISEQRNSLTTDRLDMSYGEIMSMYMNDELIISPKFQRLYRWGMEKRTRFIESILLGIPIPPIFVAEDKDGKWELVDGLQRVSTLLSFFGLLKDDIKSSNNWILEEGSLVEDLADYTSNSLPDKYVRNIKRTYCRVEIIKWDSKYDMRYELFNRLNTGGEELAPQEIRNCIFRSVSEDFNDLLNKLAGNETFQSLINIGETKTGMLYDEELVLRFIALYDSDIAQMQSKNANILMDDYMKKAVMDEEYNYDKMEDIFSRTIQLLSPYDFTIFRFKNNQFSTSLFEAITVGIAQNINYYEENGQTVLEQKIVSLESNEDFKKYVGSASGSKTRLVNRMKAVIKHFGVDDFES